MDTFWYVVFVLFIAIPAIIIWIGCVVDVIAQPQKSVLWKVAWSVGMLAFPILGCLLYMIFRPRDVVVTEPGLYDELYTRGAGEFPTASRATGQFIQGNFPDSLPPR